MPASVDFSARVVGSQTKTFPVIEIFGPTVQGEGPDAGSPAYFVRFGGCDYRCSWCDSMYAVEPAEVRANSDHLDSEAILARVNDLEDGPSLVVLSGGNPALLDLSQLVAGLQARGLAVAVETQGSVWRPWLGQVDQLVVSPKGPSSGMATAKHRRQFEGFMTAAQAAQQEASLKIVVFDEADLSYATEIAAQYRSPMYLSAGTDLGLSESETIDAVRERYRWLCERVARCRALTNARVLPQLHVLAWGTARGV